MSKDEFLTIISREIDALEESLNYINSEIQYAKDMKRNDDIIDRLYYQKEEITDKIISIRDLINYPIYVRVRNMSDEELKRYKKDKDNEFELAIQDTDDKLGKANERFTQIKKQEEKLIGRYGRMSDEERGNALVEGKKIDSDSLAVLQIVESLSKQLDTLKEGKKMNQDMDIEQLRVFIASKIKGYSSCEFYYGINPNSMDNLFAIIGKDYDKSCKVAECVRKYENILKKIDIEKRNESVAIYSKIYSYSIPSELMNRLKEYVDGDAKVKDLTKISEVKDIIRECEEIFNKEKKKIFDQFTLEKTSMIQVVNFYDKICDNLSFLEYHFDKLNIDDINNLVLLVKKKKKLSKKIFKTRSTLNSIDDIDKRIRDAQKIIRTKLISWYSEFLGGFEFIDYLSDVRDRIFDYDNSKYKYELENIAGRITAYTKGFEYTNSMIKKQEEIINKIEEKYATLKIGVIKELYEITGVEFSEEEMEIIVDNDLGNIVSYPLIVADCYRDALLKKVEQEVNNQIVTGVSSVLDVPDDDKNGFSYEALIELISSSSIEACDVSTSSIKQYVKGM